MSEGIKIIASNKKAFFNYQILEKVETGLVLTGSEVKALREGHCNFKDSYARIKEEEVWLIGLHIGEYKNAGYKKHDPERQRKLLLHKEEITRINRKVMEKGMTLVPLKIYFKNGRAKLELGLAVGKREYDKRETIARRDQQREIKRMEKKYKVK